MIYAVEEDSPQLRTEWSTLAEQCVEWQIKLLERTRLRADERVTLERGRSARVAQLDKQLRSRMGPYDCRSGEEHWTDGLVLWRGQPLLLRSAVLTSIGAKLASLPEETGPEYSPRRFALLPSAGPFVKNAVADVARDMRIVWDFRTRFSGGQDVATRTVFEWSITADILAVLLNRVEFFQEEATGRAIREGRSWAPFRLCEEPDIPDLELISSPT